MKIKIWNYKEDEIFVNSFLDSMALAHNIEVLSKEWFNWKFRESPYGEAVLSCAFDNNKVVGCVAFGKARIMYINKEYITALSYETFVHPSYRNKGLLKKLIVVAEDELKKNGVSILYNYPNVKSLKGFINTNWIKFNNIQTYKIKILKFFKVISNINQLKNPFTPNKTNFSIQDFEFKHIFNNQYKNEIITPIWSKEYIKWRFFTFSNHEYFFIDTFDYFAISVIGKRGTLQELKILYIDIKEEKMKKKLIMNEIVKIFKRNSKADIISYSSTIHDNSINLFYGFFNVPSKSNLCIKILDPTFSIDNFKIILTSINAHTL